MSPDFPQTHDFSPPSFIFIPFLFFFIFAGIIVVAVICTVSARNKAKDFYEGALDNLRRDPDNLQLRQAALEAGRAYSRLTGNQYRTYFTEASIQNDLSMIAPRASHPAPMVPIAPPAPAAPSVAERLQTLDALWHQGLITEAEYNDRRAAILADI